MRATSRPAVPVESILAATLLLLALAPAALAAEAASPTRSGGEMNPDGYTSARVCGECHTDIYESWKKSLHAFSLVDPIFDTAFMQAIKEGGEAARRVCLRCHAPLTLVNGDFLLQQGVTREGVSCDFCHTVTAVHLEDEEKPYSIDLGPVKRSVIRKTESPAHEVAYSELHGTSEFCGGCHNYVTAGGQAMMSTYDEWKSGPYASEGVQCQDCHMVLTEGAAVRQGVGGSGAEMHLHDLLHDSDQLRGALSIRIAAAEWVGSSLRVDVEVVNIGSGHKVPTGLPTREVVLTVVAEHRGRTVTRVKRYRKVVADARGRVLEQDYEVLLHGRRILNDNRIGPRERRVERFTFDLRRAGTAKVKASLTYLYSPPILREQQFNVELGTAERYVN